MRKSISLFLEDFALSGRPRLLKKVSRRWGFRRLGAWAAEGNYGRLEFGRVITTFFGATVSRALKRIRIMQRTRLATTMLSPL